MIQLNTPFIIDKLTTAHPTSLVVKPNGNKYFVGHVLKRTTPTDTNGLIVPMVWFEDGRVCQPRTPDTPEGDAWRLKTAPGDFTDTALNDIKDILTMSNRELADSIIGQRYGASPTVIRELRAFYDVR